MAQEESKTWIHRIRVESRWSVVRGDRPDLESRIAHAEAFNTMPAWFETWKKLSEDEPDCEWIDFSRIPVSRKEVVDYMHCRLNLTNQLTENALFKTE
jgi:hypothetical protein